MTDKFSGKSFTDPQSDNIRKEGKARKFAKKDGEEGKSKAPTNLSELYNKGIEHLQTFNFTVELCETGDHVKHRILRPAPPQEINGIRYPASFRPLQAIASLSMNLRTLGRRQVVRHRFLVSAFAGSNPAAPATTHISSDGDRH